MTCTTIQVFAESGNLNHGCRYNRKTRHGMDDIFLIGQAVHGNTQAFRLLVLRYQRPLFRFLNGFGMSPARVEEIAQETLLRAFQNLASYQADKGASFVTWLFVIAKRLALNELARSEYQHQTVAIDQAMTLETGAPTPLENLEGEQRQQQVRAALQQVDEPFRSALILSYIEELKLSEIAEIEQCSIGTVKSRIFRGKQQLVHLLTQTMGTVP